LHLSLLAFCARSRYILVGLTTGAQFPGQRIANESISRTIPIARVVLGARSDSLSDCLRPRSPLRQQSKSRNPPNAAAQRSKPYVVLVSLDGFRYDYAERYGAKNLLAMALRGASAPKGMIPSFPSLTFPNHYTIVTGLYPEHHGIVANSFYDSARKQRYSYTDPKTNGDGSWYGGTPLWVLANGQAMRSACFFWPGSEAEIQGKTPQLFICILMTSFRMKSV